MTQANFPSIYPPDASWLAQAEPEPVLEPDLAIVDAHLHFWEHGAHRYFIQEYASDVRSCGHLVESSVFIECSTHYRADGPAHLAPVGEVEFALEMASKAASFGCPSRVAAGIVACADLSRGHLAQETVEALLHAADGRLRGIRQRAKWDADPMVCGSYFAPAPGLYLEAAFGAGIDMLGKLGLAFDASVFHPQLPDVVALARAHPGVQIVLNHTGSPVGHSSYAGKERENHAVWFAGMKALAACPNVCVKLGGLLMNLANFDFLAERAPPNSVKLAELWRPYLEPSIELFGADRCMVASNFPVDKCGFSYGTVWNMFKQITSGCSADEKAQIYSGTAKRVYRID